MNLIILKYQNLILSKFKWLFNENILKNIFQLLFIPLIWPNEQFEIALIGY